VPRGAQALRADSEVETFNLVLQNKILRPSTLWPEVPPELDEIVLRALSLDPDQRFATAAEFAEALEELPIRISPARTVANTVEDLLTDVLTQRRDIVRSLDIGSDAWEPGALRNAHNSPRTIPPGAITVARGPQPPPLPSPSGAPEPVRPSQAPARDRRPLALALLLVLLIAGVTVGVLASRRTAGPTVAIATPPPAALVAPPPMEPAAPPPPPPAAVAVVDAGQPSIPAQPLVAQGLEHDGTHRPGRRPIRRAPVEATSVPAAPTTPAAPGEYRPGAI
jgi:hypothetical protein